MINGPSNIKCLKILVGKPKGMKLMIGSRHRRENNISYITEIYCEDVEVIHLIRERFQ